MRRGIIQDTMVLGVIALIIFIAVLVIAGIIYSQEGPKQTCKASAQILSATKFSGFNSPFELVCPRKFIHIVDDRAKTAEYDLLKKASPIKDYVYLWAEEVDGEIKTRPDSKVSEDQDEFTEQFKRIVNYELAECWDTFFEGKKDILDSNSKWLTTNTCTVCSEIWVDRTDIETQEVNIYGSLGVPHYLPAFQGETNIKDYLYNARTPSISSFCVTSFFEKGDQSLGTIELASDQSYSIVFLRRGSMQGQFYDRWFNAVDELGFGTEDVSRMCQAVWIVPSEDLIKHCDVVIN